MSKVTAEEIKQLQPELIQYRMEITIFDKKLAASCYMQLNTNKITLMGTEFDNELFDKLCEHYANSPVERKIPKEMTKFVDPKILAAIERLHVNPPMKPLIINVKVYNCSTNELDMEANYSAKLTGGYWTRDKMTIYIDSLGLALSTEPTPDYWQLEFVDIVKLEVM